MGEARRHVRDQLSNSLPGQAVAEIELLTSELVSNAVRHSRTDGDGTIGLHIGVGSGTIRISVVDGGAGFEPAERVRDPNDEGGWGLFLVEEISDRWGIEKDPHRVWFEIDRSLER